MDNKNTQNNFFKIITSILLILTLSLSTVNLAFAANDGSSVLNVKLLNQDPDPAKPGEDVLIRLKVENLGNDLIDDVSIQFIDSYPFTLFPSEKREIFVGKISEQSVDFSAETVKFKIRTNKDISEGAYPVKIRVNGKNIATFEKEFNILVKSEANAEISNISINTLVPGQKTKIIFGIKNVGKADLKNVKFSWDSANDVILPVGSSNFKYIERIKTGKEEKLEFEIVSDLNTEPKLYKLDLKLEYDDVESLQKITDAGTIKEDKRREEISKAGIYVGGKTTFDISFSEIYKGETSFQVTNIGSNLANSVVLRISEEENWNLLGSKSSVIGNLKKGNSGRASFKLQPRGSLAEQDLKLTLEYTDTTGVRQEENISIKLNTNLFVESSVNNLKQPQEEDTNWKLYLGIFLVVVGGLVWFKKKRNQKKQ